MSEAPEVSRAVLLLWDVDHTLIENAGVSKENYAAAFEILTGQPAEHRARTDGRTDPEVMADLLDQHGMDPTGTETARMLEALATAGGRNEKRLRERGYALPGAHDALVALSAEDGIIQSVLSGNIRPNAFVKLSAFDLHEYLDFEVGGYGSDDIVRANLVGIARKRAMAKYGASLDESSTVLIGDTLRDVRAGLDGGAKVIGVATGPNSVEELVAAGATVGLHDLTDTKAVVEAVRRITR